MQVWKTLSGETLSPVGAPGSSTCPCAQLRTSVVDVKEMAGVGLFAPEDIYVDHMVQGESLRKELSG